MALKGSKNPIEEFEKKFKKYSYFSGVIKEIKKAKRLKRIPHSLAVKKLCMACSYPGTFSSSIHSIINSKMPFDLINRDANKTICFF